MSMFSQLLSSSPKGSFYSLRTIQDDEDEPLIVSTSTSISNTPRSGSPRPWSHYQSTGQSSRSISRLGESHPHHYDHGSEPLQEPKLSHTELFFANHDLKPVEPARRRWGPWNYVGFWVADSFNINTWMISSSMITEYGLSWWQSWLCVWIGYSISACFVCLSGRIGSTYHIGFPVVSRASFGIWGSLWPVFNRAAMACIWYGVQAWLGGNCIKIMISSIWPGFGASSSTSSSRGTTDFVSFILFWLLSLPAIYFPVHQIRHLFTVKSWFVPVAAIAYFTWAVTRAGGIGPIVHQPSRAQGGELKWGIIKGIMSSIANFAALVVNNPDFARFARKREDAVRSQLLTIPIGFAVTSFIGIIVSSSSAVIYGEAVWNPLDLLGRFLEDANAGERVGIFIIGFAFALAQLGTNIAANSVSAGTDLTALFPRYMNIRRGGYLCAIMGIVICPWRLLETSNQFLVYLSAYSVFMSSIAGVMICDYYLVRKGFLDIVELYTGDKSGTYYFTHGFNWRGYTAYVLGIAINVVGFAGATGASVPAWAAHIYNVNYFAGFIVAAAVYWLLARFVPVPGLSPSGQWLEVEEDICGTDDYESSGDAEQQPRYDKIVEAHEVSLGRYRHFADS